jgi:hypothetical protein
MPGSDINEVPQNVLAVRGIPIRYGNGFMLYDSKEKRTLCQSVALERDGKAPFAMDLGPLPQFVYGPSKSVKEPTTPDRSLLDLNPVGSRGFSCVECVKAGLNFHKYTDEKGQEQVDRCSGRGSIVMYITHICISKPDLVKRTESPVWKSVTDIKDADGNPIYHEPFLLVVDITQGAATKSLGKKIQVKAPTPDDVLTWSYFLSGLGNDGILSDHINGQDIGFLHIPALVELWAAKPIESQKGEVGPALKSLPGFRIYTFDVGGHPKSLVGTNKMNQFVSLAYEALKTEYVKAGGKLDEEGRLVNPRKYNPLTPESQQLALASAGSAESSTSKPEMPKAGEVDTDVTIDVVASNPFSDEDGAVTTDDTEKPVIPNYFKRNGK